MKDEDQSVRDVAASALGSFGSEAKTAVPALIETLKEENPTARRNAAKALGNIGPAAKAAVPTLIELSENELDEAHYATLALSEIEASQ